MLSHGLRVYKGLQLEQFTQTPAPDQSTQFVLLAIVIMQFKLAIAIATAAVFGLFQAAVASPTPEVR